MYLLYTLSLEIGTQYHTTTQNLRPAAAAYMASLIALDSLLSLFSLVARHQTSWIYRKQLGYG